MPAADWLAVLMATDLDLLDLLDFIPNWDEMGEDLGVEDWSELALEIVTTVSARKWWITLRLIGIARSSWDKLGPDMITQVDAEKVSLSAWLGVFTVTLLQHVDKDNLTMLISQIELPPEGERETAMEEMEMSAGAFMALAR